jgi:hypothetical protein
MSQRLFVTPGWSKHIYTWKQGSSTSASVKFDVGAQLTPVWIDQLYIFKGNTDVFRRDFENGIVLANATPFAKTIQLNGSYRKILGNLDSQFNNGQSGLTEITLPAYNAVFLVKNNATGINNVTKRQLTVSPNPFISTFNIQLPETANYLQVLDMQGKQVKNMKLVSRNEVAIDMSDCVSGIYMLKIYGVYSDYQAKIYKQ